MPVYHAVFSRSNHGTVPPLKQSAEVVWSTLIRMDELSLDDFERAMLEVCLEQNPHFRDPTPPVGVGAPWGRVLAESVARRLDADPVLLEESEGLHAAVATIVEPALEAEQTQRTTEKFKKFAVDRRDHRANKEAPTTQWARRANDR